MAMSEEKVVVKIEHAEIRQKENVILKDVNLEIKSGEFVYLIGKTGSGKSSLLKTLYAELPLAKGAAQCCGFDLANMRRSQIPYLRRELGIVFQDFELLTDRSIFDNLEFVLRATGWTDEKATVARMNSVINLVDLDNKGHKMPHELSGGEQQRVVIARALLNTPQLILADEPTGNLDPATTERVFATLIKMVREEGAGVLVATHNLALTRHMDRVLTLKDGKLVDYTEQ